MEDVGVCRSNCVPDLAVVVDPIVPGNGRTGRRGRLGKLGNDLWLGEQVRARWLSLAAGSVDASGAVLHRDSLRPAFLMVDLDAAKAGQDVGYLAMNQGGPIEFCQDLDCKPELPPSRV